MRRPPARVAVGRAVAAVGAGTALERRRRRRRPAGADGGENHAHRRVLAVASEARHHRIGRAAAVASARAVDGEGRLARGGADHQSVLGLRREHRRQAPAEAREGEGGDGGDERGAGGRARRRLARRTRRRPRRRAAPCRPSRRAPRRSGCARQRRTCPLGSTTPATRRALRSSPARARRATPTPAAGRRRAGDAVDGRRLGPFEETRRRWRRRRAERGRRYRGRRRGADDCDVKSAKTGAESLASAARRTRRVRRQRLEPREEVCRGVFGDDKPTVVDRAVRVRHHDGGLLVSATSTENEAGAGGSSHAHTRWTANAVLLIVTLSTITASPLPEPRGRRSPLPPPPPTPPVVGGDGRLHLRGRRRRRAAVEARRLLPARSPEVLGVDAVIECDRLRSGSWPSRAKRAARDDGSASSRHERDPSIDSVPGLLAGRAHLVRAASRCGESVHEAAAGVGVRRDLSRRRRVPRPRTSCAATSRSRWRSMVAAQIAGLSRSSRSKPADFLRAVQASKRSAGASGSGWRSGALSGGRSIARVEITTPCSANSAP